MYENCRPSLHKLLRLDESNKTDSHIPDNTDKNPYDLKKKS